MIFFKFCAMKGAHRCMEIKLMVFPKKICLEQMSHLRSKMEHPHNCVSAVRIILQFCTMKGTERDMEII